MIGDGNLFKFDYNKYRNIYNFCQRKINILSIFRILVFLAFIICFCVGGIFNFIGFIFVICFIFLIIIHDKYYKKFSYYENCLDIFEEYKSRTNSKWKEIKNNGEKYNNELFNDLNVVGKSSLFQYLNFCRTIGGEEKLIQQLYNKKKDFDKLKKYQSVIKELNDKPYFCVDFLESLSCFKDKNINLENNFDLLNNNLKINLLFVSICFINNLITLIFLILALANVVPFTLFFCFVMINFFINFMYSFVESTNFNIIDKISGDYAKLFKTFKIVGNGEFNSDILKKYSSNISECNKEMKKLVFISDLNNLKNNILSNFLFNGLFSLNVIVMILYNSFVKNKYNNLKDGIVSVEYLEAFVSLASIGLVRDDICFPKINKNIKLSFVNIKHPLLDENKSVSNSLDTLCGVNIITGSNMGGKTTFIRTIGINILLMNAGTYVCADEFNSCFFKVFTSISVSDNIDKGISTFMGELLRIKKAIDYKKENKLVLVDEIFKGTNYSDRIYGANEVIKKLDNDKTILFVTTHDFELCECKVSNLNNYHFKEYYDDNGICFDYKIRNGKCSSTNAKYLMKKLNIID